MKPSIPSATRSLSRICAKCHNGSLLATSSPRSAATLFSVEPRSRNHPPRSQARWISNTTRRCWPGQPQPAPPVEEAPAEPPTPTQQTKQPRTHYDLFPKTLPEGPPPRGHFPIDIRTLRREFLQLQSRAHPDLHPAERKAAAQGMSALINEAFKTLSNPLLRAQYLLSLKGIEAADDERGKVEDPELLMQVMEAREEIEEARTEEELGGVKKANDERISASEEVLERAFREDDMDRAVGEVVRLRYWVGIKESLDHWEPGKRIEIIH